MVLQVPSNLDASINESLVVVLLYLLQQLLAFPTPTLPPIQAET